MSVLLDTSALFAFLNEQDDRNGEAKDLFLRLAYGELGVPAVSDWVIAELFTLLRARRLGAEIEEAARRLLPLPESHLAGMRLVTLAPPQFEEVWAVYEKHRARRLSFTDAAQLVLMKSYGIDRLATFDKTLDALANGKK